MRPPGAGTTPRPDGRRLAKGPGPADRQTGNAQAAGGAREPSRERRKRVSRPTGPPDTEQLEWRQAPSGALIAYHPELTGECREECRHLHPQYVLVPSIERDRGQEWVARRWSLWSKTESACRVDVLEKNVTLRTGMAMAEERAASRENGAENGQGGSPP